QRFLCSMWNARVISTATSQLKAGRLSKNKIYSYLCVGGIPSVSLHWLWHYLNKHSLAWHPKRLASFKRGGPFHEHIPKGTG
ncbi:hypothetical protein PVAP13_3NG258102, partial [Panicum virgatum]